MGEIPLAPFPRSNLGKVRRTGESSTISNWFLPPVSLIGFPYPPRAFWHTKAPFSLVYCRCPRLKSPTWPARPGRAPSWMVVKGGEGEGEGAQIAHIPSLPSPALHVLGGSNSYRRDNPKTAHQKRLHGLAATLSCVCVHLS